MNPLVAVIRVYQRTISPLLPPACRFTPSCSEYAAQAIERYGAARGSVMAVKRLLRCHPWHPGGHDPVPELPPSAKTVLQTRALERGNILRNE